MHEKAMEQLKKVATSSLKTTTSREAEAFK